MSWKLRANRTVASHRAREKPSILSEKWTTLEQSIRSAYRHSVRSG